jgi:hypothetical protein
MPNVVGALRVSAVAQLQAIGLSVQVTTVPDQPICNNVGTVESQTPPPGTVVAPGGSATIRVYAPPRVAVSDRCVNQGRHRPARTSRDGAGSLGAERSWCLASVKEDF